MDGRDGQDDARLDDLLGRALRRSEDEARPREEFARGLRERFVDGALEPAAPAGPSARPLPIPRWVAYPVAAAALALAFVLSGALGPRAVPEAPLPPPSTPAPVQVAHVAPEPPKPAPEEVAFDAAERRVAAAPGLAGRTWLRRTVEGRPWLLPSESAFADAAELKSLSLYAAQAGSLLAAEFPSLAARGPAATAAVVAPSRRAFEALVEPRVAPAPLSEFTIAFSLDDLDVLLVSPEALVPGGPPCEEMDVVHEAVHAWLRGRRVPGASLPLWADEGVAGIYSQQGAPTKGWCRTVLADADHWGIDPFTPEQVLEIRDYGSMAKQVAAKAPCEERPFSLLAVFYAHAESLVLFLQQDHPECVHRAAFHAWLAAALDGRAPADAAATAKALGFESVAALFAARDEWLRK